MSAAVSTVTLISFDVDGTLIENDGTFANKLHKDAFCFAFKKVFDLDTRIDVIKHQGGTDPLIIIKVLEHHGISKEEATAKLKDMELAMVEHFEAHIERAGDGLRLLPGVRDLLQALQERPDVATCLVTGNLEPIGWGKMRALGIDHLFTSPRFGGFGSDYCSGNTDEMWRDRGQLVTIAAERAAASLPVGTAVGPRFHVGDTPMDVQAALAAGAVAIGVTTGVHAKANLEAHGGPPEVVILDGLMGVERMLQVLGLEPADAPGAAAAADGEAVVGGADGATRLASMHLSADQHAQLL